MVYLIVWRLKRKLSSGPEDFLESLESYASVKKSSSDETLFVLTDKKVAALDQSLSELNLLEMMSQQTSSEVVWKTITEFQKDPYTTGLSIFSKMADKILFSPHEREFRPEEEMAELLQVRGRDDYYQIIINSLRICLTVCHLGFLSGKTRPSSSTPDLVVTR